jgi:ABC-type uncharacterized transport system permease subunit
VAGLSFLPFGASSVAAFGVWELLESLPTLWKMVIIFFVWIGVFAIFTQLFWKVVDLLAT